MAKKQDRITVERAPLPDDPRRLLRRGGLLVLLGFVAWAIADIAYTIFAGVDGTYSSYVAIQAVYVACRILLGFGSFFLVLGYIRSR